MSMTTVAETPASPGPLRPSTTLGAVLSEAEGRGTGPTESSSQGVGRVPAVRNAQAGAAGTRIELVTDFHRFLELESEWNAAVDRAGVTHPFLTHEWFRTWWECFGGGSRSLPGLGRRGSGNVGRTTRGVQTR